MFSPCRAASARHWSSAICTHVDPAPVMVGPEARAAPAGSTRTAAARAASRRRRIRTSAEPPVDVIGRAWVDRLLEDLPGVAGLDDMAGLTLTGQEERAVRRDALR